MVYLKELKMKEELLNEAARNHYLVDSICPEIKADAFKDGARWHESLPLAERLTEKEKDKIIVTYNIAKDWASEDNSGRLYAIFRSLERIFGKDLFTDKSE